MPRITISEVSSIENQLGRALPELYRKLLVEFGHGCVGLDAEIYHPLEVRDLYEPFLDDPTQLFNPFFPFGCDNQNQELWIIDADSDRAASIWHETHPDDWPEGRWISYSQWIDEFLDPIICGA